MENFLERPLSFRKLAALLTEELATEVVEKAWEVYLQASEGTASLREALKAAIRQHLIIPGFRPGQAHRAPPARLKQAVVKEWRAYESMVQAIFRLWAEAEKDLLHQVSTFLREAGLPTDGLTKNALSGYWKLTEFQRWTDRFREAFPEIESEDTIHLAIALLTGRLPVPDEFYSEISRIFGMESEMGASLWTRILEEIRNLPAEAPEWEALDEFLQAAREIGEAKQRERALNLRRTALREAIETFHTSRSRWIEFFQMDQCASWNAHACPLDQLDETLALLKELGNLIAEYEKLYDYRPLTMQDRRRHELQLGQLEDQIWALYTSLTERLTVREQEERTPPSAEETIEETVRTPTAEESPEVRGPEEAAPEESPRSEEAVRYQEAIEETASGLEALSPSQEGVETLAQDSQEITALTPPPAVAEEAIIPEAETAQPETTTPWASSPRADELEEAANRTLVSLLCEGDLLTGYWLAWAMERQALSPRIPSTLIQALQGAFWAMRMWPELPGKILYDLHSIPQQMPSLHGREAQWIGTAAALYLALVAPLDGWGDWLHITPDDIPALKDLAASVRSFAAQGWALQPEDIKSVWREAEREQAIESLARKAQQWLEMAPNRTTAFQRATAVWRRMTQPKGPLHEWLVLVARNQQDQVDKVREALESWWDEEWVDNQIRQIDIELVGRRLDPIQGTARKQIIRWVSEACELADKWAREVKQKRQIAQRGEWLQERLRALLEQFADALPEIDRRIGELLAALPEHNPEYAALSLLQRSIRALERVFDLPGGIAPEGVNDVRKEALLERSLQENLAERLLRFPEAMGLDLDERGGITVREEIAGDLLRLLLDPAIRSRSPEEIVRRWIELGDYRFMDHLLAALLPSGGPQREALEARWREALRSGLRQANEELDQAVAAVEQALIDGLISELERRQYIGSIEAVRKEILRTGQQPEGERHRINLRDLRERLRAVHEELEGKRQSRLQGQRQHWTQLQESLPGVLLPAQFEKVRQAVERALKRGEIRVVDEYLVGLEDVLQGKRGVLESLLMAVERRDHLREFQEALQPLTEFLKTRSLPTIAREIALGKPPGELGLPHLPASRKEEIFRALNAWHSLKSRGIEDGANELQSVAELMRYLGFRVTEPFGVSLVRREPGLRHWRVAATPERSELVPVPQFGSERNGEYDILGLWDRPGFNLMSALMERAVDRPAIVFYFERLSKRRREDLLSSDAVRFMRVPVLILDETLLVFLAREYDVRTEAFFACTLPYTNLNPYVPFAAGSVPPEMFVGRRKEIQQLLDPLGPAIVYGGRQLGKSALLRQVGREFHDPSRNRFAILEDIRSIGDPYSEQDYERAFWERLTNAVNRIGFLNVPLNISPKQLLERIRRQIEARDARLLLLLDEADNFLEADAGKNFAVVGALKRLMDDTGRRFKVVFAGLHNVQRFQRIPNQPFAHLGQPIEVGPLEPDAARELLERPLRALGFRFGEDPSNEDPSVVLHVLSYTNYHPGLIQLFAKELVDRLRSVRRLGLPPFGITRADVEMVYRQDDVRRAIRDRFVWTLALDERYEAIALSIILDQWEARNGFDRLYRPVEIRTLVQDLWPAGFKDMGLDQFKGYLDEMCGLGVLDRVRVGTEDQYRLRSPNVVKLMGTRDELEGRLLEIMENPPSSSQKLESYHALLEEAIYSPLTYAQESTLRNSSTGLVLVFGSEALQIEYLKEATRRLAKSAQASPLEHWEEIPILFRTSNDLIAWLESRTRGYRGQDMRVFFRNLEATSWTPEELEDQVQAALKFCSSRPWARVIFAFGPMAAWQWFQLPAERRESLEERVGAVVTIRPLDLLGIRQRLMRHEPELMAHDYQCRRVHQVTGGWPFLLDEFLKRCQTGNDPILPLEQFAKELAEPSNPVRRRFRELLQIPHGLPTQLIERLREEQRGHGGEDYWIPYDIVHLLLEEGAPSPHHVKAAVEYLIRMSILRQRTEQEAKKQQEPEKYISLDPVIYRLWNVEPST